MKRLILICSLFLIALTTTAQSNEEIARVYIKKAQENYNNLEIEESLKNFNKAVKLLDTITKSNVARLGALIHYELSDYRKAKDYSKHYFTLAKKKTSEEYNNLLELYVNIEEEIEKIEEEEKRLEEERIRKEKELRRIDSLKVVWKGKSDELSLTLDSIYKFNKNNVGIYQKSGNFGILNDKGTVLVPAEEYQDFKAFDEYILLLDKANKPTKIYCYNTKTKQGINLPNISDFNPIATHYGKVMLPRGNGRIVTYPNNSHKAFVFDIPSEKIVRVANEKELFKTLKKADRIDKSNKDGQVKINKEWYNFGGHIGGGIHPLYNADYSLHGFLCAVDGTVITQNDFNFIGPFYNNKAQATKGPETYWVNQNGTKVSDAKDKSGNYKGASKVVRGENGNYQIFQKIDGKEYIILGNQKLEKMVDFLRSNSPKK